MRCKLAQSDTHATCQNGGWYHIIKLHNKQYFTLPHWFRTDSGKSGGIRWNSTGIPPESGGIAISFRKVWWNSTGIRWNSGFIPVSVWKIRKFWPGWIPPEFWSYSGFILAILKLLQVHFLMIYELFFVTYFIWILNLLFYNKIHQNGACLSLY